MSALPGHAWKVLTAEQKDRFLADGVFHGAPVDLADGYIHLSAEPQVAGTLDKHFAGQSDLWLARVDLTRLGDLVRWERSRGDALFPHIYAPLPLDAVTALGALQRADDGSIVYPT
ncbi:DUF952 domain-containing protein [Novosphingobium sp.]|uniref:DUF952 domain-containing protein n=1 Tax=Novosphingobium sp. TaxID=1874826 RepID=UPI0025D008C4|nr:DUF952 domain-containing protein [Novosphingobium sp.]MCC6925553.1 DUF952 domain-containing protein [Novosphingobium sp.]